MSAIDFPGAYWTTPQAINDFNQIVGEYQNVLGSIDQYGFEISEGKYIGPIEDPYGVFNFLFSITNSGEIMGTSYAPGSGGYPRAFTDVGGQITTLHLFPQTAQGINTISINKQGQLAGSFYDDKGVLHSFRSTNGKFFVVSFPGAAVTTVWSLNDAGEIVGQYSLSVNSGPSSGFTEVGGVYTTIMFPGSSDTEVYGLNDAGILVGYYYDSTGVHGFIATPQP